MGQKTLSVRALCSQQHPGEDLECRSRENRLWMRKPQYRCSPQSTAVCPRGGHEHALHLSRARNVVLRFSCCTNSGARMQWYMKRHCAYALSRHIKYTDSELSKMFLLRLLAVSSLPLEHPCSSPSALNLCPWPFLVIRCTDPQRAPAPVPI